MCPCNGNWAFNTPRVISNCGNCSLNTMIGAHGLFVGLDAPAYGSVLFGNGKFAMTELGSSQFAAYSAFDAETDHAYKFMPADSGACALQASHSSCPLRDAGCCGE
jgi:hypothetical protein